MAVAAYASLVSLMHVLDNVQHPARRHRLRLDEERIKSLQEKVQFLQDFLEVHSQRKSQEMEDLARQITVVVHEADDVIDLHAVDQLSEEGQDKSHHMTALSSFCQDLDIIIGKIESITRELMMIKEGWDGEVQEQKPVVSVPASSPTLPSGGKNAMVGFDHHLLRVMDELTKGESNLHILPITGMGGIGKTTLAQNAFDHPYVVNYFDVRIWFTISQEYSVQEILLGLLNDKRDNGSSETDVELGERLYKKLFGRRYLIVLDDVWSIKVWEDLNRFFPNNRNGSRIMMTTRLKDVAVSLGSLQPYLVSFLDENNSWNLLCEKVFGQEGCPYPELEKIGKDIAKGCAGLPLAIVVIGGLLANSNMRREYWEFVANNVNSFAHSDDNNRCLKILSLSYNHLPIQLKPCFLYMGVFREDDEIFVSELIKLWIAEGFLKPVQGKTLEEVAEENLKVLVDRNLILVRKWMYSGKFIKCGIHDLLRDLCLIESEKEHFIRIPKVQKVSHPCWAPYVCALCSSSKLVYPSTSDPSSLVCNMCESRYPYPTKLRWVKVIGQPDERLLQHTKLRYIDIMTLQGLDQYQFVSPATMSLLWNLRFLCVILSNLPEPIVLPSKIWEMPQLRQINMALAVLPDPVDIQDSIILENLNKLSLMYEFKCTNEVLERIPNLKMLGLRYFKYMEDWSYYCLHNLVHLQKLEILGIGAENLLLEKIAFPASLKVLVLAMCGIPWEDMIIIGSLPNLEVLVLQYNAFKGCEWNPVEEQFLRLKVLSILDSDLVRWTAENIHFPNLESLYLDRMYDLEEIPSGIGDIATLRLISLSSCSSSAVNSAKQILEEQQCNGNEDLQLCFDLSFQMDF
ncbi:Disease resistance RPP8-like protein 3 [Sesamum alatum]|uniref:Disease resistance RPP8-like protein 3 n=1 Tax=Sesamum alatum TaxID=300844 RepID=A0AAE1YWA2_9LAMI|nr:Disease resistance RPP8-like protein 3 [Sesamum alatum]